MKAFFVSFFQLCLLLFVFVSGQAQHHTAEKIPSIKYCYNKHITDDMYGKE